MELEKIVLENKIEEIEEFIKEFTKKKEDWERFILGFSTEAYKYKRLISFLDRLIDLEKKEFLTGSK